MPRFSVAFGRRKSGGDNLGNVPSEPSFRVLDRSEVLEKGFDGGARLSAKTHHMPTTSVSDINVEDNIFADLKTNRGSGSSNTTSMKTTYTDNSSRHSNASTAPSSTHEAASLPEEPRNTYKKPFADIPIPPVPKTHSGFLKGSGRSWSFGGQKKHHPAPIPMEEEEIEPPLPPIPGQQPVSPTLSESSQNRQSIIGRARATTTSTATTVTPPKLDTDFSLDLGGDFSRMLGFDKRASVLSMGGMMGGENVERAALGPRSLTGSRAPQPTPLQIDQTTRVEAPQYSWSSQHSNDRLVASPTAMKINDAPPPVPRHGSPLSGRLKSPSPDSSVKSPMLGPKRQASDAEADTEDEDSKLLKDSLAAVSRFMSKGKETAASGTTSRYRRNEDTFNPRQASWESKPTRYDAGRMERYDAGGDEGDLFGNSSVSQAASVANRYVSKKASPPQNKVMTPAQFERYRKDKERQDRDISDDASDTVKPDEPAEDEDNYEDDDDEIEKAKQQAKQRRKQEAHMAVYRQQMMKVTGESASNPPPSRPSFQMSLSTPNLFAPEPALGPSAGNSDNSDEDEEVPLAILAAHGFPNKNRPPTRLSTMMSNPNLRAAQQPSYQRPSSVVGPSAGAAAALPAFARKLPQDPFVGAGLVNNPVRESFHMGGGAPSPSPGAVPPGGLIGVIANEERNRAARRGSPRLDNQPQMQMQMPGAAPIDPITGIPSHMMYPPKPPMLTPGDQAQIQMTQQMQQFMQMQMQFMQMMAGQQNGGMPPRPMSQHAASQSMGNLSAMNGMPGMDPMAMGMGMGLGMGMNGMPMGNPEMMRHSFVGNESMLGVPREDVHVRSMSMVQPSSASWIQPQQNGGYAPSIRGAQGYAPSIAPSERSNIGLPGRYRPVSQMAATPSVMGHSRNHSNMSSAFVGISEKQPTISVTKSGAVSDDDDEEGWAAMKASRDKKKSIWKSKKSIGAEIGALIS